MGLIPLTKYAETEGNEYGEECGMPAYRWTSATAERPIAQDAEHGIGDHMLDLIPLGKNPKRVQDVPVWNGGKRKNETAA
jgi:hypothetical protein